MKLLRAIAILSLFCPLLAAAEETPEDKAHIEIELDP